jgi:hypothetical protein
MTFPKDKIGIGCIFEVQCPIFGVLAIVCLIAPEILSECYYKVA